MEKLKQIKPELAVDEGKLRAEVEAELQNIE